MPRERIFSCDYNRPLSIEELNIARRLECETDFGMDTVGGGVLSFGSDLQAQSFASGAGERRREDAVGGAEVAEDGKDAPVNRGDA